MMGYENKHDWHSLSVEDFLEGDYLDRSDVALIGGGGSIFSWLIRLATRSHFSHAALVFLIPQKDNGFSETFLIESITSGVDITNLGHYVKKHKNNKYVAILRQEDEWFEPYMRKLVRGQMLNHIKATYDVSTIISIASKIFRKLIFGVQAPFFYYRQPTEKRLQRNKKIPSEFICSGSCFMTS